jgi:hypothetical protein
MKKQSKPVSTKPEDRKNVVAASKKPEIVDDVWKPVDGKSNTYDAYLRDLIEEKLANARGFVEFNGKTYDLRKAAYGHETIFDDEPNGSDVYTIRDGKTTLIVHHIVSNIVIEAKKMAIQKAKEKAEAKAKAKEEKALARSAKKDDKKNDKKNKK